MKNPLASMSGAIRAASERLVAAEVSRRQFDFLVRTHSDSGLPNDAAKKAYRDAREDAEKRPLERVEQKQQTSSQVNEPKASGGVFGGSKRKKAK